MTTMAAMTTTPSDWSEQVVSCNYSAQLSPMISMSPYVSDSVYCYPSATDYPHNYPSSVSSLSSSQMINSLSYQAFHQQQQQQQQQMNYQVAVEGTEHLPHQAHQRPQEDQQQASYPYSGTSTTCAHSIKLEAMISGSSEVTSTSTNELGVDCVQDVGQVMRKGRKGKKKGHKKCQKRGNSVRQRKKPEGSYASLIWRAIDRSPNKRLKLSEIYDFFRKTWPEFFTGPYIGWKNSVRHNLSLNECFMRVSKSESDLDSPNKSTDKGSYWIFLDKYRELFDAKKGYDKRRPRNFRKLVALSKEADVSATFTQHDPVTEHFKQSQAIAGDYYRESIGSLNNCSPCVWSVPETHLPSCISMAGAMNENYFDDVPYSTVN